MRKSGTLTRAEFIAASGKALAGSALCTGLVGCGGGGEDRGARLRMSWWSGEARQRKYNRILDLYERENPPVNIAREYVPWDNYWDKFATQVAGGNAPDVLLFNHQTAAEYIEKGVVAELDPYLSKDLIDLGDFDAAAVEGGKYEGAQYLVAMGSTAACVLMNRGLLREAGIEEALDPQWAWTWTWEDFRDVAVQASQELGDGIYGAPDLGGEGTPFDIWLRRRGKVMLRSNSELGFDESDLTEWLEFWDELRRSGGVPPGGVSAETPPNLEQSLFATRRSVAGQVPVNQYPAHQQLVDDEIVIARVPNGSSGANDGDFLEAAYMGIYSRSQHPEEVAKLIDFWVNDPEAVKIDQAEQGAPAAADMRKVVSPLLNETEQKVIVWIEQFVERGARGLQPLPPRYLEIELLLARTNQDVAFDKAKPAGATREFFSRAESTLA